MRTFLSLCFIVITGLSGAYAQRQQVLPQLPPCGQLQVPAITGTAVSVVSSTTANVKVDWASAGTATYTLWYKPTGGSFTQVCSGASVFNCTANGLQLGTTYLLRVTASRSCKLPNGEADTDSQTSETTITLPPPAPTGLAATNVTPVSFFASWQAAPSAVFYRVDVSSSPTFGTFLLNDAIANATTASIGGLTSGTTYYYRVRSVSAAGTSANSATFTVAAVKPAAPASLSASPPADNQFTINWAASAGAVSYRLDVATDPSFSTGVVVSNQNVSTTSWSVTSPAPNATYYARVRAVNPIGASDNSPILSYALPPAAPANLSASAVTTGSFTASWQASPGATSYRIDVGTAPEFTTPLIVSNASTNATSFNVTGLSAGTTYYLRVRAFNNTSTLPSANSTTQSAQLLPAQPTITGATSTATSITITWTTTGITAEYALDYSEKESFENLSTIAHIPGTALSYTVTSLTSGKMYFIRIRGMNATGSSANSDVASAVTPLTAPVTQEATGIEPNFFVARWTTVPGATMYWLDVSADPGFSTFVPGYEGLGANTDNIPVSGLSAGTTYYCRIKAGNDVAQSDYTLFSVSTPPGVFQNSGTAPDPFKVTVIPPSPEAAALAKYADIPVSLYSGTPSISVPLYDVKERSLTLPISLSYHASGNKVETIAPRTGLGWTLCAGGAVTRSVRGLPDEHVKGFLQFAKQYNDIGTVLDLKPNEKYLVYGELADGCRDGEPDVFYYNFLGYSGQFMFDWDGQLKILSGGSILIEPLGLNPNPTAGDYIDGWKITVDDGTVFTFSVIETTKVLQIYENGPVCSYLEQLQQGNMPQTWYVSEMRSPDQQSWVRFEYDGYTQQNESWSIESMVHNVSLSPVIPHRQKIVTEVSGKVLRKITVSSGQTIVDMLPAASPRTDVTSDLTTNARTNYALGQVHVTNANNRVLKHWDLDYNYATNRLTLTKVTEHVGNAANPPYEFSYSGSLPEPLSFQRDHWGFVNGNSAATLVPAMARFRLGDPAHKAVNLSGADRSPSPNGALAGLLTEITYPTGGKDVLTFETHDYSFAQSQELIKKITLDKSVSLSLPNDPLVSGEYQSKSETFTLKKEGTLNYSIFFSFGYAGPGGGNYSGVATLKDSKGMVIFSLAPGGTVDEKGEATTKVFIDSLEQMPADTYTLTTTVKIPPGKIGPGVNTVSATLSWKEDTGQREPQILKGGGARIAKITRVFGNSNPDQVTVYNYRLVEDGKTKSSGSLLESGYVYDLWMPYAVPLSQWTFTTVMKLARFSQNRTALGTTQGSHVGYSQVTVLHGPHGENGATVYNYDSPREVEDIPRPDLPFPPAESRDFLRGLLLRRADYNAGGIGGDTVHCVSNHYTSFDHTIPAMKVGWAVPGAQLTGPDFLFLYAEGNYSNRLGYTRLSQTSEKNFDHAGEAVAALEQVTRYEYNETTHKQLIRTSSINSKNETIVSAVKYPRDYGIVGGSIGTLQTLHMDNVPVEQVTWRQEAGNQVSLLGGLKTEFVVKNNGVVPSAKYGARITAPVTTSDPFSAIQPLYEKRLEFSDYDGFLNLKEHALTNGMKTGYQWGHNSTLPTAKADHAASNQIFFESFEENAPATTAEKRTGRQSRPINGIYNVPPANLPKLPGDYILSYWTKTGTGAWTYQEKTITGYTSGAAIATSAVIGFIDDVRVYPVGAQMTTYTYEPALGITSVTDAANMTVFYEYDELNRLTCVRDLNGNIVQRYDYQFKKEVPYQPLEE